MLIKLTFFIPRLLQISSFNGKMNALNEVNKVISSVSYYTHRHNPEEEEWLTAERMAVSSSRLLTVVLDTSISPGKINKCILCTSGMDPAEPHPVNCAEGQFASAAVRRETGEDPPLRYQRESSYHARSGQHLGCTGNLQLMTFLVFVRRLFLIVFFANCEFTPKVKVTI